MKNLGVAAAIAGITLVTFFHFPGHTWIQQDTQIYAPILEHFWNPEALRQDLLVQRPHVSFTVYDETALALRRFTGLDFETVLGALQVLTRGLGVWGVYLMAGAVGFSTGPALLAAAALSLGAAIGGPSVLTLEYEPNPRGFAVPLLLLATGLTARGAYLAAGAAGAAAFLLHPPTVYPFWGLYFLLSLWPGKPEVMRRRLYAFIPLLGAALLLLAASRHQAGVGETQIFFSRLAPEQETLQRMRASYVWISTWWRDWLPHYFVLYGIALGGFWRIREKTPFDLRVFLVGLPLVGMLSMPASWLLLERMKWALIPQFQPMRALLFVVMAALFVAVAAAAHAAARRRYWESFLWLVPVFLVPSHARLSAWPGWERAATALLLAGLTSLALAAAARRVRWAAPALGVAALAGFFLLPTLAGTVNYPRQRTPELAQLSGWARHATHPDSVFLFPDAGIGGAPGIFRAEALRAVYVDWKGGGQVNYLRELGEEWWRRWQEAGKGRFHPDYLARYETLPIDYIVLTRKNRLSGRVPVFENGHYLVYRQKR